MFIPVAKKATGYLSLQSDPNQTKKVFVDSLDSTDNISEIIRDRYNCI